jgi:hypothetical protein
MQEEFNKSSTSEKKLIPKSAGYSYVKKDKELVQKTGTTENRERKRMSTWWVLLPFFKFFAKYLINKYDPRLVVNMDETSLTEFVTQTGLIVCPHDELSTYIPSVEGQQGLCTIYY